MPKTTCIDAYAKGQADRRLSPLKTEGRYKLNEVLDGFSDIPDSVDRIAKVIVHNAPESTLRHCTGEDMHIWLINTLSYVAYRLGRDTLPALLASVHEDANARAVHKTYLELELRTIDLVMRLEDARKLLGRNINHEYRAMHRGHSFVKPLFIEAIEITRQALSVANIKGQWLRHDIPEEITTGAC